MPNIREYRPVKGRSVHSKSSKLNVVNECLPYKMAVTTMPIKLNTRGGAAIDVFERFAEVKAIQVARCSKGTVIIIPWFLIYFSFSLPQLRKFFVPKKCHESP
jgi:hypothetical protein